jgi:hypothetical protein
MKQMPEDAPPAYRLEADQLSDLPDLSDRLKGLKLDSPNVSASLAIPLSPSKPLTRDLAENVQHLCR